jgi:hypothetical protein
MFRAFVLMLLGGCQLVFPLSDVEEPPTTLECSSISTLATDFSDGALPPWTNLLSTRFSVQDEALRVVVDNNASTVFTEPYFDLRGSGFQVRVQRDPVDQIGEAIIELQLVPGTNEIADALKISSTGTTIVVGTVKDDQFSPLRMIDLDPARPFLRISEAAGVVRFEIGDGASFQEFQQIALAVSFVRPRLTGRSNGTSGVAVTFDDINGGVAAGTTCSVAALADDFAAPTLDLQRWGRSATNGCTMLLGEGLTLQPDNNGGSWNCQLNGTTEYDLFDRELAFELDVTDYAMGVGIELTVLTPANTRAGFRLDPAGNFSSFANLIVPNSPTGPGLGTTLAMVPFDPLVHRVWRLRAQRDDFGEQLVFETSDGITTTPFLATGDLVGLGRSTVSFQMTGPNATATNVHVRRVTTSPL